MNDDDTWSYARVSAADEVVEGAFTWRYVAQARYASTPRPVEERQFVLEDKPPERLVDQLVGMRRVDSSGEVWEIAAVDEKLLDPGLVADVDAQVAGWSPSAEEDVGTVIRWQPEANWSHGDCTTEDPGNDTHAWDGESRTRKTSNFTDRQLSAIHLTATIGASTAKCSGTLVNPQYVLTAAHCLENQDDSLVAPKLDWLACDPEYHCSGVAEFLIPDAYNNTALDDDYDDDWAVLVLDSPLSYGAIDMDIFGGADSDFTNIGANVHLNGYPFAVLTSSGSCDDGDDNLFVQTNALVTSTAYARIKLKSDGAVGQSGAGYFFCPDGDDAVCADNDVGMVVGVHSGWNPVEDRYIGPRGAAFRAAAIALMEN
ncbi:MAG: trypsin-like serine protease [Myxococcota bacterium]